jgi:hypothetical protein
VGRSDSWAARTRARARTRQVMPLYRRGDAIRLDDPRPRYSPGPPNSYNVGRRCGQARNGCRLAGGMRGKIRMARRCARVFAVEQSSGYNGRSSHKEGYAAPNLCT